MKPSIARNKPQNPVFPLAFEKYQKEAKYNNPPTPLTTWTKIVVASSMVSIPMKVNIATLIAINKQHNLAALNPITLCFSIININPSFEYYFFAEHTLNILLMATNCNEINIGKRQEPGRGLLTMGGAENAIRGSFKVLFN